MGNKSRYLILCVAVAIVGLICFLVDNASQQSAPAATQTTVSVEPTMSPMEELMGAMEKLSPEIHQKFSVENMVGDWGKVEYSSADLNMIQFREWFELNLEPALSDPNDHWMILDGAYRSCDSEDMVRILAADTTKLLQFQDEYRDCDDMALIFKARINVIYGINAIAIVNVPEHSWDIFIDSDCQAWGIDPNSGRMWPLFEPGQPESCDPARLIFFMM